MPKRKRSKTAQTPRTNGEYRQIGQTLDVLALLAQAPQSKDKLMNELGMTHPRTVDRFMRALSKKAPIHLQSVPGSGNPPRYSLDLDLFLARFKRGTTE